MKEDLILGKIPINCGKMFVKDCNALCSKKHFSTGSIFILFNFCAGYIMHSSLYPCLSNKVSFYI